MLFRSSPLVSTAVVQAAVEALGEPSCGSARMDALLRSVNEAASEARTRAAQNGATTLACVRLTGDSVWISTAGDSSAVSIESDGSTQLLTEPDHVPSQPNVLLAWIDGDTELVPHVVELDHMPYRLCLATDGVTGTLDLDQLAAIVSSTDINQAAEAVVRAAQEQGARDDVTCIVIGGVKGS